MKDQPIIEKKLDQLLSQLPARQFDEWFNAISERVAMERKNARCQGIEDAIKALKEIPQDCSNQYCDMIPKCIKKLESLKDQLYE